MGARPPLLKHPVRPMLLPVLCALGIHWKARLETEPGQIHGVLCRVICLRCWSYRSGIQAGSKVRLIPGWQPGPPF